MQTYDPTEVTLSFNAVTIDGFGDGTFIKVSRNEPGWSLKIGNSGTGARSRNPNKAGKLEITLLTSSSANALLTTIALTDELSAEGVGAMFINDRSTLAARCSAENMWIIQMPDFERAKEVGTITWILETDLLNIAHDGLIDA